MRVFKWKVLRMLIEAFGIEKVFWVVGLLHQFWRRIRLVFKLTEIDFEIKIKVVRSGRCLMCGKCCSVTFECPYLYYENGVPLCRVHKHKPIMCRLYPLSEEDKYKHIKNCGYKF